MSEARIDSLSNESNTGGPTLSGITTFSGTNYFVPPVGDTAERPENPEKGSIRFNTDTKHLEYYRGDGIGWAEIEASSEELDGGHRGVFMGGHNEPDPSQVYSTIDYITLSTLGNALSFGDLISSEQEGSAFSSSTRGFYFGGDPAETVIETIVFASAGSQTATSFGNLTATSKTGIGLANATRGIAYLNNGDIIDYVTMASTGTPQDFGNASFSSGANGMGCASPTRGIIGGAYVSPTAVNILDYLTISTTGNTSDFGDLTNKRYAGAGASNAVRGVFMSGWLSPAVTNTIDYITLSTLGNAIDFGDVVSPVYLTAGCSSSTRMVMGGGLEPPNIINEIQYVTIPSTGNAQDFGDLSQKRRHLESCSNGHGGL